MLLSLTNNFFKGSHSPKSGFLQKSREKSVLQMYTLVSSAQVELAGFDQRSRKLLLFLLKNLAFRIAKVIHISGGLF